MHILQLSFFHTFNVELEGIPLTKFRSARVKALLVYLALQPERAHARDMLAAMFWPDDSEARAKHSLRQSLYQLRQVLRNSRDIAYLTVTRQSVQFNADIECRIDVLQLDAALEKGDLAGVERLYTGELLPGFTCDSLGFEEWLRNERERRQRLALDALGELTELRLAQGDTTGAQASAQRQLALEPWREEAHRQLMRILAHMGERSAALAQYRRCADVLMQELGIDVSAETKQLYQQISAATHPPRTNGVAPQPSPVVKKPNRFKIRSRLDPLPDQQLFGIETALARVRQAVAQRDRPNLIALDGIGGIGKTTLAHAIVQQFIDSDRFADIGWVSAKQEEYVTGRGIRPTQKPALDATTLVDQLLAQLADGPYPTSSDHAKQAALADILQAKPCLIVIDNLETAIDYEALLPLLRLLVRPSKFLLTSRLSLHNEPDVFCHSLQELAQLDALALLRHEAAQQNIHALLGATDTTLIDIYQTVGGNPLALRLVVGQAHFLPLTHILEQLRLAKSQQIDQLYNYVYWQAWQMLDPRGRDLLISMPLMPNGSFNQLIAASQMDALDVQAALAQLKSLSLVQVGADDTGSRYRLHRLTETFLLHEVLKWGDEQPPSPEATLFENRIQNVANHWHSNNVIGQMDVATLDREKDAILTAIRFGLTQAAAWPVVKALIFALTSYMERRGHWEAWFQTLEQAIALARRLEDMDGEIALTNLRGRILERQGHSRQVVANYWHVIRLARKSGNQIEEARACSNLGYAYVAKNHWWRSKVLCCHAMTIFKAKNHQHGIAHTHNHLGLLFIRLGDWGKAEEHLLQAYQLWETNRDMHGQLRGAGNLGLLYNEKLEPTKAVFYLEKAAALSNATGEINLLSGNQINLAFAYLQQGQFGLAEESARKAEKIAKTMNNQHAVCQAWGCFAEIYSQQGLFEQASQYFHAALAGVKRWGGTIDESWRIQVDLMRHEMRREQWSELEAQIRLLRDEGLGFFKGASRIRLEAYLIEADAALASASV